MRSRRRFSATCCSGLVALLLCLSAPARPDVSADTRQAPLPESLEAPQGKSDEPQEASSPEAGTNEPAASGAPTDTLTAPEQQDVLATLVAREIFPSVAAEDPEGAVSRAYLADVIVRAMGYPTRHVSEFPFYRDVPREHWAYVPVETARLRKLVIPPLGGFYYPDAPASYMTVYWALSNSLIARNLSVASARTLLEPFEDQATLNDIQAQRVALLVNARIIAVEADATDPMNIAEPTEDTSATDPMNVAGPAEETSAGPGKRMPRLRPQENITWRGLAPLLARLIDVTSRRPFFITQSAPDYPDVPAGVVLSISPTRSIFEARLDVGDVLYFTLEESDAELPKGSRLRGEVVGLNADGGYRVRLNQLRTVEDELWDMAAGLQLTFPENDEEAFIVPGERFQVTTEPVPLPPGETPLSTAPPPLTEATP